MNIRTTLTAAALAASIATTGLMVHPSTASPSTVDAPHPHHTSYDPTRTPCANEDGPGPCFWDAAKRGNHRGASYWIGRHGWVHYVDGVTFKLEGSS